MDRDRVTAALIGIVGPARVQRDAALAGLTTFRVGGPADWLVTADAEVEVCRIVAIAHDAGVPLTVLGGGSNVVIADAGIRGVTLRLHLTTIAHAAPDRVRADGGVTINGLVRWTIGHGLAGLEAWAGTPGTVGGAIFGNAHFSGRNIGDLVAGVRVVSREGEIHDLTPDEMAFAYDTSRLRTSGEVLLSADFIVTAGEPDALRRTARASLAYRKTTQPLAMPSAGCIFQNPDPAVDQVPAGVPASAGALIDRAGLKDHRVGGARISPTHANFLVNDGTATAADIRALIDLARLSVRDRFGIELKDEVVFLGEWPRADRIA